MVEHRQPCACGQHPSIYRYGLTDDTGTQHTWHWCRADCGHVYTRRRAD